MRLLLCLSLLLSINLFAYELQVQYRNYDVNEGLPSSQIYEVIEDSKGYIWFGTDRGVVRYNGYEFETFTIRDGLTTNVIFHLDEGDDGTIYCYGKDRKISCLVDNEFREFKYNDSLLVYHSHVANLLKLDFSNGGFTVASFDNDTNGIPLLSISNGNIVRNIAEFGIHIIDDETGLFIFGRAKNGCNVISINGNPVQLETPQLKIRTFADIVKYGETIYFSIGTMLYQYDWNHPDEIVLIKDFEETILDIEIDDYGNLYLGIRFIGLIKLPRGNFESPDHLLKNASISCVKLDTNNGIWASSLFRGLFYFEDQDKFTVKLPNGQELNQLQEFKGTVYGLPDDIEFFELRYPKIEFIELKSTNPVNQKFNPSSVIVFNDGGGYFQNIVDLDNKVSYVTSGLKHILKEDSAIFGVATSSIHFWNYEEKCHDYINFDLFLNCSMIDENGDFIIGTDEGIKILKLDSLVYDSTYVSRGVQRRLFKSSCVDYRPKNDFFRYKIRDMQNIGDTLFVFSSAEKGIYITEKSGKVRWLKKEDGLISDAIDRVYVMEGYMVATSKKGISVITEEDGITNYTRRNGLLSNEVRDVLISNDFIWAITKFGTSVFPLTHKKHPIMPIKFTSCKINGVTQPLHDFYELEHEDGLLEISFEALSYIQEGDINYKFQLKGMDKQWVSTSNTTVRYSNLFTGNFSFWVKAQNSDNIWSEPICLFKISKSKPIWLTFYFIGLEIVFFIALTWLFFAFRYKRIQQKEEDKLQVLNLERKTLQAQMNPHVIFNSLTSLQNIIVKNEPDLANEYLGKFARLTRIALLQSTQNWVKLKDELTLLGHYVELEQIRFPNHFEFKVKIELEDPTIFIPPFLIQPFIENAVLHGLSKKNANGLIEIIVKPYNDQMVQFTIVDNGVGRGEATVKNRVKNKSLGIRLIKERLQLLLKMNAVEITDLFDDEGLATGTKVVVYMPYKKKLDESINN